MKLLDANTVFALLEGVHPEHLAAAQLAIPLPADDAPVNWLEYGVKEGIYSSATMTFDGMPAAVIFFTLNDRRVLVINGCHSLMPNVDMFASLEIAFRRIAYTWGVREVEYVTRRAGAVRKSVALGYSICGVVLRRKISEEEIKKISPATS